MAGGGCGTPAKMRRVQTERVFCHVWDSLDPFVHHPHPQGTLSPALGGIHDPSRPMSTSLYPLASLAQVEKTPSREDGIPEELELDLRAFGSKLIYEAGVLLRQ